MLQYILDRLPYLRRLRKQIRAQGMFPAGHYHSPIPDQKKVSAHLESSKTNSRQLFDINLNGDHQYQVLAAFQNFYAELPFPEEKQEDCRYYYHQDWFC